MEALQRRVGTMSATNSPSQTPRSGEKFSREFRPGDRDKGVNIQVILRCRPLSDEESKSRSAAVITCSEARREVSASLSIANKQIDRTFTFDKVFGPTSKQKDLFELAVAPVVNEVLEGYNCTIFAYGQTGTGKTYTMEGGGGGGGRKIKKGELPSDAGVIPRSVQRIFRILDAQDAEYSVKVSFLELYNEEITDLLAPEELRFSLAAAAEDKSRKPIALMEDGKGGVLVRGLEEEIVCSADEIYKILDKGSAKRRTAETLLNKQSSRSHSIFTITIHIKERTPEGEELIKCGKLNLVDLAGSENISRSGARDGRAREAGEINKSLLTLGRVINSLVEHSGHVPYRESKLTRLLRDSLGGKTKTCIIATIAPSVHCLEETLSTLDYAHRAKHIKNKPEINQRMMKSEMIKDLYSEIDRLKQEVYAAREKNGIYIPAERYVQEEAEKKAMAEKLERLEIDLDAKDKQLAEVHDLYNSEKVLSAGLGNKLNKTKNQLASTQNDLHAMEERHKQALATIKEKEYFICNLQKSEKALLDRAFELRSELQQAVSDISGLFSKIERKDIIEDRNKFVVDQFQTQLNQQLDLLHRTVSISVLQQENQIREMEETMQAFVAKKSENTEELRQQVGKLKAMHTSGLGDLDGLAEELSSMSNVGFTKMNTQASAHSSAVEDCFTRISVEADQLFSALQTSLASQKTKLAAFAQTQHESHDKAIEWTRLISTVTSDFFKDFDMHTSKMSTIIEETQTQQDQKLCDLQKNFEECAANEERQIMEKVAEMLASSTLRKKMLVQLAVDGLRETAADRTKKIQEEMCSGEALKSSIKRHWTKHTEESEDHYHHTISLVQQGHVSLGEGLQQCVDKTKLAVMQWKNAKDSVLDLEKENVTSVESIARNGTKESNVLQQRLSTAASAVLADTDSSTNDILALVDENLQLDREACTNISIKTSPCCEELRELKTGHQNKTTEIKGCTQKCFFDDYQVDKPSCCTPRRRPMTLPSESCIRELQTPTFEELLKSYSTEVKIVCELANAGGVKQFPGETDAQRDSRTPFSTIN